VNIKLSLSAALAASALAAVVAACSSSRNTFSDEADTSPNNAADGGFATGNDSGLSDAFAGCAKSNFAAKALPAAMIFVLDKSGTMAQGGKFANAENAIVMAMDADAFDSMSLGLLAYPTSNVTGPSCVFGLPVLCGVSALPQVPLAAAGSNKSSAASGVRRQIYDYLAANAPQPGNGDGNPTYDAMKSAITALQASSIDGKRILVYITDGGASCASVSTRPGYKDGNGCNDWEYPQAIVDVLKTAHDDPKKPVNAMIVGVPGADTHGENQNVPPYSVRLALSSYAAVGSPETIDPSCDGRSFTLSTTDPVKPCHFDMSKSFTADELAKAITKVRGELLGCIYDLPQAEGGKEVDKDYVNVEVAGGGGGSRAVYKRKDASDDCAADGCWDYTPDGKVRLIGKACTDVKTSVDAKVQIVVGCKTMVK
jgi:hypothetical protein